MTVTDAAHGLDLTVDADGLGRRVEKGWSEASRRDKVLQVLLPFAVVIPVLAGWELYTRSLDNPLVPGPTDIAAALPKVLTLQLLDALIVTNLALLQGFLVAAGIGILLGIVLGRFRAVDAVVGPYLNLMMVTPMVVVMPIILMAIGLRPEALAVIVFLFALPYVTVPCRTGVRAIPTELIEMARSFGAREPQLWREVILPGMVPYLLTGLRLGFGQGMTGIIVAELTLLAVGIGKVILIYQSGFQQGATFAVTMLVILECVVAMGGLRLLEMRQPNRRSTPS